MHLQLLKAALHIKFCFTAYLRLQSRTQVDQCGVSVPLSLRLLLTFRMKFLCSSVSSESLSYSFPQNQQKHCMKHLFHQCTVLTSVPPLFWLPLHKIQNPIFQLGCLSKHVCHMFIMLYTATWSVSHLTFWDTLKWCSKVWTINWTITWFILLPLFLVLQNNTCHLSSMLCRISRLVWDLCTAFMISYHMYDHFWDILPNTFTYVSLPQFLFSLLFQMTRTFLRWPLRNVLL